MLLEGSAYLRKASHACAGAILAVIRPDEWRKKGEDEADGWRSRVQESLMEEKAGCSLRLPPSSSWSRALLLVDAETFDYDSPSHSENFGARGVEVRVVTSEKNEEGEEEEETRVSQRERSASLVPGRLFEDNGLKDVRTII